MTPRWPARQDTVSDAATTEGDHRHHGQDCVTHSAGPDGQFVGSCYASARDSGGSTESLPNALCHQWSVGQSREGALWFMIPSLHGSFNLYYRGTTDESPLG